MANDNSFLYDSYKGYLDKATAAKNAGNNPTAQKYYLLAAEALQKLALQSEGELKRARYDSVKKLIAAANALDDNRIQNSSRPLNENTQKQNKADDGNDEYDLDIVNTLKEKVAFDDIIGLKDAKLAIHRMLIYPLQKPEVYKQYNLSAGGYILLEGPPGTGKTTFAKAAACEISLPFVNINCNNLVDSLIGATGKNIDKIFNELRRLVKNRKTSVIAFFDEFDAISKSRLGDDKTSQESVPSLIRQLDGFDTDNENIVILAATNIKENIDKAILSRMNKSIYIPLPAEIDRKQMFALKFKKMQMQPQDYNSVDFDIIAKISEGLSGRDINNISKELANILAERDGGITECIEPLTEVIMSLIEEKKPKVRKSSLM